MKNRTALVTGATGFIGKYVVARLLEEGLKVFALTRADNDTLPFTDSSVQIIKGDIANPLAIPEEVGIIYHCAGIFTREEDMERVNVLGTQNIVEAAIERGCRLIHLSSAGVVGITKAKVVDEETTCSPFSLYERTKLQAETAVVEGVKRGLKAQMLRPTIVFGTGRPPGEDSFLQLISAIASGAYRNINGGHGIYNIVYAGEVARAMYALDSESIPNGMVYIINTPLYFSEFASIVSDTMKNRGIRIRNIPYVVAFTAAAAFSFLQFLTGKKRGLTFSRMKALTDTRTFSQGRLLKETAYKPLHGVDEYLRQLCAEYSRTGLLG